MVVVTGSRFLVEQDDLVNRDAGIPKSPDHSTKNRNRISVPAYQLYADLRIPNDS